MGSRLVGSWRLPKIGAHDGQQSGRWESPVTRFKLGQESPNIAGHSPLTSTSGGDISHFWTAWQARSQRGPTWPLGRGVVETAFSSRISSHSPFDWTGNRTSLP